MISVSGVSTRTSEFKDIFPSNVAIDRKEYFSIQAIVGDRRILF